MKWVAVAAGILAIAAAGVYGLHRIQHDPNILFLYDHDGAQWIRFNEPFELKAHGKEHVIHGYRVTFAVPQVLEHAVLHVQGTRAVCVYLDGVCIAKSDSNLQHWKNIISIDMAPHLAVGTHSLRVMVGNSSGPACAIAWCPELGIHSDATWQASADGKEWNAAIPVKQPHRYEPVQAIPTVARVFWGRLPLYAVLFTAVLLASYRSKRRPAAALFFQPAIFRWLLLGGWLVMAANNLAKLPVDLGFDHRGHLEYIAYVAQHWRVPLASDGWQMFQSPLYYFLSAPILRFGAPWFPNASIEYVLRIVPLLCGAGQLEICYRAARRVFPARGDLQIMATTLGGLLPMNIYISQFVSNEPLAGLLIGWVILLAIPLFQQPESFRLRQCIPIGVILGLALLAKVTALLVVFPLAFAIAYAGFTGEGTLRRLAGRALGASAIVFGLAGIIAGWYYIRNYIELGRPFIGGWDISRGIEWWQDPGYRTPAQLMSFGDALVRPVFSGIYSFWDGMYSTMWMDGMIAGMADLSATPPWNYGFAMPGMWFALLPTLAIAIGVVVAVARPMKSAPAGLLLAATCAGIYLAALILHFLTNPFFCAVKAFYALGAISSLAILAGAGFERLLAWKRARPVIHALFACWAVSAYGAFFVW